ncbi:hypothetical protein ACS0TY_010998 [Phlomoides rotata]
MEGLLILLRETKEQFVGDVSGSGEACKPGAHRITLQRLYFEEQKLYKDVKVISAMSGTLSTIHSCKRSAFSMRPRRLPNKGQTRGPLRDLEMKVNQSRLPSLIHKLLRPEVARLEHVDIGHLQLSSSHSALKSGQFPADFNISDGDNGHKNTSTSAQ